MSASNYNSEIQYEALQEVINQLIAKLYFELNSQENGEHSIVDETITNLINFKKTMTPDNTELYNKTYAYVRETMAKWNF